MLAVNFKLTSAQVKLLLQLAYWDYTQLAPDLLTIPRREGVADMFIVTVRCLVSRGLVKHCPNEFPHHQVTDAGKALADMIVNECRGAVELADSMPKRLKKLAAGIETCRNAAAINAKRLAATRGAGK